ncbi:hypothetical protein NDS46_30475 (plasmid) [Paenibacillus thiaminolyticus]|uniref:hypothetical protein n=1 Tax=Paenibacillus thiaminolyticus TaxID=49283 RepID=UPI00232E71E1|nr:hypothetical protein [Paenibacillus thiaminolyticus]WCF11675.1 hypothetical protein NDS46_30475 [Paenibacillus thiaminolyticus]
MANQKVKEMDNKELLDEFQYVSESLESVYEEDERCTVEYQYELYKEIMIRMNK